MSGGTRPRAVFDCMVFLQATASPTGPAARCLLAVEGGIVELVVCDNTLREVRDVLSRPAVRRKNPRITDGTARELLEWIERMSVKLADVPQVFVYPRDPKDEPFVNLAVTGGASYLVTRDKDLLDLARADSVEGKEFAERFPGLTVLDPIAFLEATAPRAEARGTPAERPADDK
jgi:putative PIN family toxin of toxin-antitoxin system